MRGFWTHYPKSSCAEADWKAWERAGRPRTVSDRTGELPGDVGAKLPHLPATEVGRVSFSMFSQPSHAAARKLAADRALARLGIRKR
jgi:hypothetical protein